MEQLTLPNGPLTFSALGCGMAANAGRPLVLCLHGFPDNPQTFKHQLPALADAGYRAIAPTLRGYEPSSQPADGDYTVATMARDVLAWLDGLGEERVHLVGHDWGAAITYAAGSLAPERFASLTTIAVPHSPRFFEGVKRVPGQLQRSWYMSFFQLRGLADWALERNDWALVRRLWRTWSPGAEPDEAEWAELRATFEAPGVKKAMLAYYRQNASPSVALGWKASEAMKLTIVPVRTLAITGADDGCIDTRMYDHTFDERDFPAGFRIERIAGAGHFVQREQPDEVTALLLEWLGAEAEAPGR